MVGCGEWTGWALRFSPWRELSASQSEGCRCADLPSPCEAHRPDSTVRVGIWPQRIMAKPKRPPVVTPCFSLFSTATPQVGAWVASHCARHHPLHRGEQRVPGTFLTPIRKYFPAEASPVQRVARRTGAQARGTEGPHWGMGGVSTPGLFAGTGPARSEQQPRNIFELGLCTRCASKGGTQAPAPYPPSMPTYSIAPWRLISRRTGSFGAMAFATP